MAFYCFGCHEIFKEEDYLIKHIVSFKCECVFFTGFSLKEAFVYSKEPILNTKNYINLLYTLQKNYLFDHMNEFSQIIKAISCHMEDESMTNVLETLQDKKQCPFCNRTFSTSSNLYKHVRNKCGQKVDINITNSSTFEMIEQKFVVMRDVIRDKGLKCTFRDFMKDERMAVYRKEFESVKGDDLPFLELQEKSDEYYLFHFMKRNPFFHFEIEDGGDYLNQRYLMHPKVYMYVKKNFDTNVSNTFDECLEVRHMAKDDCYTFIKKNAMIRFINRYFTISKNLNIYVESSKSMNVIIHYRQMIVDGKNSEKCVKKDVLFRPKNVIEVFTNFIQTIYLLMLDIVKCYITESEEIDMEHRMILSKMIRSNLLDEYTEIMDNSQKLKLYIKNILVELEKKNDMTKMNLLKVRDRMIYTGELSIYNKILHESGFMEKIASLEESVNDDMELLKKSEMGCIENDSGMSLWDRVLLSGVV